MAAACEAAGCTITPHQNWQTITFVAALRVGGLTAPGLLDGPMDGDAFPAYLDQVWAPTVRSGDIVVMDNLAVRTTADGRRDYALLAAMFNTGARLQEIVAPGVRDQIGRASCRERV